MERQNNIVLAGTKKISRAIIGVRAFDSLPSYAYVKVYTVRSLSGRSDIVGPAGNVSSQ